MLIAGIDYSLTSPSICVFNSEEAFCFKRCAFYFLSDVKKNQKLFMNNIKGEAFHDWNSDFSRYENISDWAMDYLIGCEQVAIEGYAFGAKGKVFHIAENTGVLKYRLHQTGIPVEVIPPSAVKKQAKIIIVKKVAAALVALVVPRLLPLTGRQSLTKQRAYLSTQLIAGRQ
jgi:hypothetical protein